MFLLYGSVSHNDHPPGGKETVNPDLAEHYGIDVVVLMLELCLISRWTLFGYKIKESPEFALIWTLELCEECFKGAWLALHDSMNRVNCSPADKSCEDTHLINPQVNSCQFLFGNTGRLVHVFLLLAQVSWLWRTILDKFRIIVD